MQKHKLLLYIVLLIATAGYAQFNVVNLKTEYQQTPLGLDILQPNFSWQMSGDSGSFGNVQNAYQVKVADENQTIMWDTGKVESGVSVGITYNGKSLAASMRYKWIVTVWNNKEQFITTESWFETGLLNPDPQLSAWNDAKWIGGGDHDLVFYSHYLTVYKFRYEVKLDKLSKSSRASFVFGANDERLMDRNMNTEGLVSAKNQSYIKVELDISKVDGTKTGTAKLNIYRVGYDGKDSPDKPFKVLEIPIATINLKNKYDKHQIVASSIFGVFDFYVDGNDAQHTITVNDKGENSSINLNPVGWGADFIAYPAVGDIGFSLNKGQKATFYNVAVMNNRAPSNILFEEHLQNGNNKSIFSKYQNDAFKINDGRYTIDASGNAVCIIENPTKNGTPMLRTMFKALPKVIKKARLYATARGIYEIYLNGQKVGKEYFSPGLTQYNKTQLYQTYDVTAQVRRGDDNVFGAILSEGWWSGNITFTGNHWNFFGDRQSLLAKLVITYSDGSEQIIGTNPDTWSFFKDGPIRYGSFFQGEVYDAEKEAEITGWNAPGFDDANWGKTYEVGLEKTTYTTQTKDKLNNQDALDFSNLQIKGQPGVTASVVKTIQPVNVEEVRPGVFVYDMGQNMVGFPKIEFEATTKGDTIMMRYGEVKYPDLDQYSKNKKMVMLENMRAAMVRDIYYCKGDNDVFEPRFTFHGFRYLEITGIKKAVPLKNITGIVISSIDSISAGYETSNTDVNRLWENIEWSTRGNFLYIPTDTPARNERMGWSGDISVFSNTATYMAGVDPFLRRHMQAMRDLQSADGRFTDTAPVTGAFGGILWGSAGIIVAWEAYQQYGDMALLSEHYDAMKQYMVFLKSKIDPVTGSIDEGPLGDWLSPENYKTDDTILWDAYYAYNLATMSKIALLLGKDPDARQYESDYVIRKAHFNVTHFDQVTGKTLHSGHRFPWGYRIAEDKLPVKGSFCDTQASYAIPLYFNIVSDDLKDKAAQNLAGAVRRSNTDESGVSRPEYSLMTGFIGTAAISKALSINGYNEEAYKLLQQDSYPSWLYSVKNGATTIWERLDSYTKDNGFGTNNSMNSFNHYSFGAVGAWMINFSLGIERDGAGFKKFILQPTPDPTGKMTFAKGFYNSIYGKITSEWKIENKGINYNFTVPANTTATLYLTAEDVRDIKVNGNKINKAAGVTFLGRQDGKLKFNLLSGIYSFEVKK